MRLILKQRPDGNICTENAWKKSKGHLAKVWTFNNVDFSVLILLYWESILQIFFIVMAKKAS